MLPLGSSSAPYLVPSAGSGVPLRAGAFVSLRVQAELGGGLYRVLAGGLELSARSSIPLKLGSLHRAHVERASPGDPRLILRLLPSTEARRDSILAALGLPQDAAARLALGALLAEGLRPEAGALARIRRAILRSQGGADAERAEIAAGLEAKGLGAEAGAVESLLGLGGEGGGGREGGRRGRRGGENPAGRERHEAEPAIGLGTEPGPPGTEPGPPETESGPPGTEPESEVRRLEADELLPALGAFIRSLLSRAAEPEDPRGALLGLYNHASSPEGASFLVPFRFALDSVAFSGSFRVHLPYMPGGPSRIEARFAVQTERAVEDWSFLLESEPGGASRLQLGAGRPLSPRRRTELEAELAASGCRLLPGGREGGESSEIDLHA